MGVSSDTAQKGSVAQCGCPHGAVLGPAASPKDAKLTSWPSPDLQNQKLPGGGGGSNLF